MHFENAVILEKKNSFRLTLIFMVCNSNVLRANLKKSIYFLQYFLCSVLHLLDTFVTVIMIMGEGSTHIYVHQNLKNHYHCGFSTLQTETCGT